MAVRQSRSWLVVAVILVGLVVGPVAVQAQCVVASTNKQTFTSTIVVTKTLTASGKCRSVGNNNVLACAPGAASVTTTFLAATATTAATNPSCSWQCTCTGSGNIRIDKTDGLPVELMDFEVVDGDEGDVPRAAADSSAETSNADSD
ncbi:MAG: hypothetical protein GY833_16375, partial [Aestuariibacter sp.]|nr:hypothetical protein [Aestuariibacter sp.]